MNDISIKYQLGFGNELETEAESGTLPLGQNSHLTFTFGGKFELPRENDPYRHRSQMVLSPPIRRGPRQAPESTVYDVCSTTWAPSAVVLLRICGLRAS
jgi:hypothetical protein